jgi:hypothetical protein
VLQLGLGLAGILTIGFPIVLGGLLAIIAASRTGSAPSTRPETAAIGPERS